MKGLVIRTKDKIRCAWCGDDPLYINYHDTQWGIPLHDDDILFEMLILEGMQAGLSWITILKKRENFRKAFDGFDVEKIARYDRKKTDALFKDKGIIRNRLKINAAVVNAQAFLQIQKEYQSFDNFIWQFVDHKPVVNHWQSLAEIPAKTEIAEHMSRDLKRRGFKFVGPTICYAYMQAAGLVNDHVVSCYRHAELS